MFTLLGLGFLLGMRHALEADHAAAVASLAIRGGTVSQTVKQGFAWGIGHSLTLLAFSSVVLIVGSVIPDQFAKGMETAVGIMLVGLGLDVIRRMRNEGIHFHLHRHPNQSPHFHAHSHLGKDHLDHSSHHHSSGFPYRALLVGLMHGMAGSAALILLMLHTTISTVHALLYILVFGLGSILGMGVFSCVMAIPLWYSARSLTRIYSGLQVCVGTGTTILGLTIIYQHTAWWLG